MEPKVEDDTIGLSETLQSADEACEDDGIALAQGDSATRQLEIQESIPQEGSVLEIGEKETGEALRKNKALTHSIQKVESLVPVNRSFFFKKDGAEPDPCVRAVRDFLIGPTYPMVKEDVRLVDDESYIEHAARQNTAHDKAKAGSPEEFLKHRRAGVFRRTLRHTVGQSRSRSCTMLPAKCCSKMFGSSHLDLEHYVHVLISDLFDYPHLLQEDVFSEAHDHEDLAAELIESLIGVGHNNMERLWYQNTVVLMAETSLIYQKPVILMADLGKPTSFGSAQRSTRRIVLLLYPTDFAQKFSNCIDDAKGRRLRHPQHDFLVGYELQQDYNQLQTPRHDHTGAFKKHHIMHLNKEDEGRMLLPGLFEGDMHHSTARCEFIENYFKLNWDGMSDKPDSTKPHVWCAIVLLSVIGQAPIQKILNGGETVDSKTKKTTDQMHVEIAQWFNKLDDTLCYAGDTQDKADEDDEQHNALAAGQAVDHESALDEYLQMNVCSRGPENQDGLCAGANLCAGMWADLKRRLSPSAYCGDWSVTGDEDDRKGADMLNLVLAVLMMYVATLAPTIAFGGLLQDSTETLKSDAHYDAAHVGSYIGITETMLAQGACGVLFALIGGQHLSILRPTGPVVAFIGVVYAKADSLEVDFLDFWGWVSLWCGFFLCLFAVFDVAYFIKYVTNFTEDVFSALISTLFLYAAIHHIEIYITDDSHTTVAAISLIFLFGTNSICLSALDFKNSRFLGVRTRELISNFNMLIAIIIMSLVCALLKGHFWHVGCPDSDTHRRSSSVANTGVNCTIGDVQMLNVPTSFGPTDTHRDWIVKFWELTDVTAILQSVLYGFLLALLFFVEQNITSVMLAKPENRLKKEPAFHWDMFVVGIMVAGCGLFGLPVAHASLPHSLYHVRALANKEHHPPRPPAEHNYRVTLKSVTETRVSALMINGLILATIPALSIFDKVPLPVVYGLFFYMGYSALCNNPMVRRLSYFFYEAALFPPTHVFRTVEPTYIHSYTAIQLFCLFLIWLCKKMEPTAAYFPFVILAMVPLRIYILPKWFDESPHVKIEDRDGETRSETHLNLDDLKARCTECIHVAHREWLEQSNGKDADEGSVFVKAKRVSTDMGVPATTLANDDTAWVDRVYLWIQQIQEPKSLHETGKFERQTQKVVRALRLVAEEDYLSGGCEAEAEKLAKAMLVIHQFPPISRLSVLDAHDDGEPGHEKKG